MTTERVAVEALQQVLDQADSCAAHDYAGLYAREAIKACAAVVRDNAEAHLALQNVSEKHSAGWWEHGYAANMLNETADELLSVLREEGGDGNTE